MFILAVAPARAPFVGDIDTEDAFFIDHFSRSKNVGFHLRNEMENNSSFMVLDSSEENTSYLPEEFSCMHALFPEEPAREKNEG